MSDFRRFHNALRILSGIDSDVFKDCGGQMRDWPSFLDNPWVYFIRADDAVAEALWLHIEGRQR